MKSINSADFINNLRAEGVSCFTSEKFSGELSLDSSATSLSLWRLRKKGKIATPLAGFHVIVPPEYRKLECLPPEHFIDNLMRYLGEPYYVALLSAGEIYGAAHQRPQTFQVMVEKKRKPIRCGKVKIQFYVRKNVSLMPCIKKKVPTGYFKVSSPEATVFDLIGYVKQSAGLDNVAGVLLELEEHIRKSRLVPVAELSPVAWSQRLGCLLSMLERKEKLSKLLRFVNNNAYKVVGLSPSKGITGVSRMNEWKVALNEIVELDI